MEESIDRSLGRIEAEIKSIHERLDRQNEYILRLGERLELSAAQGAQIGRLEEDMKELHSWRQSLWRNVVATAVGITGIIVGILEWVRRVAH